MPDVEGFCELWIVTLVAKTTAMLILSGVSKKEIYKCDAIKQNWTCLKKYYKYSFLENPIKILSSRDTAVLEQ